MKELLEVVCEVCGVTRREVLGRITRAAERNWTEVDRRRRLGRHVGVVAALELGYRYADVSRTFRVGLGAVSWWKTLARPAGVEAGVREVLRRWEERGGMAVPGCGVMSEREKRWRAFRAGMQIQMNRTPELVEDLPLRGTGTEGAEELTTEAQRTQRGEKAKG